MKCKIKSIGIHFALLIGSDYDVKKRHYVRYG